MSSRISVAVLTAACITFVSPGLRAETRVEAPAVATHPMDALTSDEIRSTVEILRQAGKFDEATRVVSLTIIENAKSDVRAWNAGQRFPRH